MSCIVELLESRTLLSASVATAVADSNVARAELGKVLAGLTALKRTNAAEISKLTADLKSSGQLKANKSLLSTLVHGQATDLSSLMSNATTWIKPARKEVNNLVVDYKHLLKQKNSPTLQAAVVADASTLESDSFSNQQGFAFTAALVISSGGEVQALKAIGMVNAANAKLSRDVTAGVTRLNAGISALQENGSLFRAGVVRLAQDAQSAMPGAVTFSDAALSDTNWTASLNGDTTTQASFSAGQTASGGNPGPYRSVTLNWSEVGTSIASLSSIFVASLNSQAIYNPSQSGAIESISYSMDAKETSADNTAPVDEVLVLVQNGTYYLPAPSLFVTETGVWTPVAQAGLVSSDFNSKNGPPVDFSSQGGPIELGYMSITGDDIAVGQRQNIVGTDNWSVTIYPVT